VRAILKTINNYLFVLFIAAGVSGCSSFSSTYSVQDNSPAQVLVPQQAPKVDLENRAEVRAQLLKQLDEWQGVPYRYGGLSKRGVDCSGFTYLTFAEQFGIRLPRTTGSQVKKGIEVDQSELLPGDLIFFNTGYQQRHMGVYVGKKQFIHASSSRGVMISRLDNPYWQDAYWLSRRVF
jgi:cell wall-associated NlpC family hydrolase